MRTLKTFALAAALTLGAAACAADDDSTQASPDFETGATTGPTDGAEENTEENTEENEVTAVGLDEGPSEVPEEVAIEEFDLVDEERAEEPGFSDDELDDQADLGFSANELSAADAFACGSAQLAAGAIEDQDDEHAASLLNTATQSPTDDQAIAAAMTTASETLTSGDPTAAANHLEEVLKRCEQLGYER